MWACGLYFQRVPSLNIRERICSEIEKDPIYEILQKASTQVDLEGHWINPGSFGIK